MKITFFLIILVFSLGSEASGPCEVSTGLLHRRFIQKDGKNLATTFRYKSIYEEFKRLQESGICPKPESQECSLETSEKLRISDESGNILVIVQPDGEGISELVDLKRDLKNLGICSRVKPKNLNIEDCSLSLNDNKIEVRGSWEGPPMTFSLEYLRGDLYRIEYLLRSTGLCRGYSKNRDDCFLNVGNSSAMVSTHTGIAKGGFDLMKGTESMVRSVQMLQEEGLCSFDTITRSCELEYRDATFIANRFMGTKEGYNITSEDTTVLSFQGATEENFKKMIDAYGVLQSSGVCEIRSDSSICELRIDRQRFELHRNGLPLYISNSLSGMIGILELMDQKNLCEDKITSTCRATYDPMGVRKSFYIRDNSLISNAQDSFEINSLWEKLQNLDYCVR